MNASDPAWLSRRVRSALPSPIDILICYGALLLAAGFGQWLGIIPGVTIILWPPNGVYLAVLLLNAKRTWPVWVLVAAASELTANVLWFHNPVLPALAYVGANAAEVVCAAWLLGPCFAAPARLGSLRQVLALLGIAVGLTPVIGATIGSAVDAWIGKHAFLVAWPLWWVGDATGVLIAAPLTLVLAERWGMKRDIPPARVAEALALTVALVGISFATLSGQTPFLYLFVPPLLWASARFEFLGAVLSVAAICLTTALFTKAGLSVFAAEPARQMAAHVEMQLFLAISAATTLVVAALAREHREAIGGLVATRDNLAARVAEQTSEIREREGTLRLFIENAPAAIAMFDRDMRYMWASRRWLTDFRLPENVLGRAHYEVFPDVPERWKEAHRRGLAGETQHADADRFERAGGPARWVKWDLLPWYDAGGRVGGIIIASEDITDRKHAEERERLLMREVNHRAKNMLGLVQSIARQTAATNAKDFVARFAERVQALSASQDLLVKSGWRNVRLEELVRAQLGYFADLIGTRIKLSGPALEITATAAQAIGMAVHELATNASKYGALSNGTGIVTVSWQLATDSREPRFVLSWTETGGPPVTEPKRRGFGSTVTGSLVRTSCDGEVETIFASSGLVWRLSCPACKVLDSVTAAREPATATPAHPAPVDPRRILVVEDEPLVAIEVARMLEGAGFQVLGPVGTVDRAIALVEETGCAAAVLDVYLGRETSEPIALRLARSGTPFIVTSGYSHDQLPLAFGRAPRLGKPLQTDELIKTLRRCLSSGLH